MKKNNLVKAKECYLYLLKNMSYYKRYYGFVKCSNIDSIKRDVLQLKKKRGFQCEFLYEEKLSEESKNKFVASSFFLIKNSWKIYKSYFSKYLLVKINGVDFIVIFDVDKIKFHFFPVGDLDKRLLILNYEKGFVSCSLLNEEYEIAERFINFLVMMFGELVEAEKEKVILKNQKLKRNEEILNKIDVDVYFSKLNKL